MREFTAAILVSNKQETATAANKRHKQYHLEEKVNEQPKYTILPVFSTLQPLLQQVLKQQCYLTGLSFYYLGQYKHFRITWVFYSKVFNRRQRVKVRA